MVLRVVSRRWSRLVLVLAGLAALATCGSAQAHAVKADSARQIESQSARRITVGAVLDLSAGWTALGQSSRVALRLAVSDANAALRRRGLADRVVLRISDAAGSPAEAARAVRRLARAGARIIVGPEGSSEVAAAKPVADELKVILVSQGSTAHSLAVRDWVFRFVPDDVQETQAAAALIAHDGVSAIVPIWRDDAGNAGLASSIRPAVSAEGGTVSEGIPYASDDPDFPAARSVALRAGWGGDRGERRREDWCVPCRVRRSRRSARARRKRSCALVGALVRERRSRVDTSLDRERGGFGVCGQGRVSESDTRARRGGRAALSRPSGEDRGRASADRRTRSRSPPTTRFASASTRSSPPDGRPRRYA